MEEKEQKINIIPDDVVNEGQGEAIKESRKERFLKSGFWQAIKFTLFSISAGVIQIGTFTILYELIQWNNWWACHLISLTLSVVWNFTFNRKYTFKSSNNVPVAMLLVLAFYCAFTPASVFGGQALKNIGWDGTLVEALMMIINFALEFVWQKFVVFNRKVVPDRKQKEVEQTEEAE